MAKNDSIIKLVLNAVMVVMFLLSILSSAGTKAFTELSAEYVKVLIFTLPPIVSVVLSILTLKNVNYIEELPEESGQSYIEYSEDNPSYFGQY